MPKKFLLRLESTKKSPDCFSFPVLLPPNAIPSSFMALVDKHKNKEYFDKGII